MALAKIETSMTLGHGIGVLDVNEVHASLSSSSSEEEEDKNGGGAACIENANGNEVDDACLHASEELAKGVEMVDINSNNLTSLNKDKRLEEEGGFQIRQYQVDLIEVALRGNVILCLPTGSGKTFIALKVIERVLADNYGTGKKVIFIANTVPLVKQQAGVLRGNLPFECNVLTLVGEMGTDFYNQDEWIKLLAESSVLVMTPEILRRALLNKNILWQSVCLLILDECHNATGEHPYVLLMESYKDAKNGGADVPLVLGLTATIVKGTVKASQIETEIDGIQNRLYCRAVTHPNFDEVLKFSTNASVHLESLSSPKYSEADEVCVPFVELIETVSKLKDPDADPKTGRNINQFCNHKTPIKRKLENLLRDVVKQYKELGPYCARLAAMTVTVPIQKYYDEVFTTNRNRQSFLSVLLTTALTTVHTFQDSLVAGMNRKHNQTMAASGIPLTNQNRKAFFLTNCISEKLSKVLEILKQKNSACVKENEPLCGLIFCEKRITTQLVTWYLQDLARTCAEYSFLKVDFIIGGAGKLDNEESRLSSKWQTEMLQRFRNKDINVIVATAVLEEGLDVRSCNMVVRFDGIQTYPSYIQSMGRARMQNAEFHVLIPESTKEQQTGKMSTFKMFNEQLAKILAEKLGNDKDADMASIHTETKIPTFCLGGNSDNPKLLESDAVAAVYRYCSMLKNDGFVNPTPVWWAEHVENTYKGYLKLPCNSPIRDQIEGDPNPNQTLAKRSVFRKACELLYEAGEITATLLPRKQDEEFENEFLSKLAKEISERNKDKKQGAKGNRENYQKVMALQILSKPIKPNQNVYVHEIQLSFEAYEAHKSSQSSYFYDYKRQPRSFGFVSTAEFKKLPPFSLLEKTGKVKVKLVKLVCEKYFSESQLEKITHFQKFLLEFVYCTPLMDILAETTDNKILVVPLIKGENGIASTIDWQIMQELREFRYENHSAILSNEELKDYKFNTTSYKDAVIVPCYKPSHRISQNDPKMLCVEKISTEKTSFSIVGGKSEEIYMAYYLKHWGSKILNPELPLLECRAVGKQRNYLWCGKSTKTGSSVGTIFEYPPELVRVTPIPASFLLQGKFIPSIVHRINRLVLALTIRHQVGLLFQWDTDWKGTEEEVWEELETTNNSEPGDWNDEINKEPKDDIQENVSIADTIAKDSVYIDFIHPDKWTRNQVEANIKYRNGMIQHSGNLYARMNKRSVEIPKRAVIRDVTKGLISQQDIKFPSLDERTNFDKVKGPSAFQIMEALTLANANDYMSLERKEVMGDSILKFVVTAHLFSNFPNWKEGNLTSVRTQLIRNEHLCAIAMRRKMGTLLSGGIYSFETWTPPGFQVIDVNTSEVEKNCIDPKSISFNEVSDKSMADATEALIGAYYMEGGIDSALRVMHWIGLQGPGEDAAGPFSTPYCRETSFTVQNLKFSVTKKSPKQIIPYLEDVEKIIDYKFKNEWLLVEALTHPTFMQNRVTRSYQRLEFLGDAVIDFLITTYIINHTEIKDPGRVTDLRSALVNNVTFGCLSNRYQFWKYFLHASEPLQNKILDFDEVQRKQGYSVTDPYMLMTDAETSLPRNVDIPKPLGDIFESIVGAIYVDSSSSLDVVWKVVYRLMKPEIDAFSKNIPINPVRKVMEKYPGHVQVEDIQVDSELKCVQITVTSGDTKILARGVGTRKKLAKEAAAKHILKKISK